ncbi:hypothetical protein ACFQ0R_09810 [Psychroflexus salinarum]|uniref:Uncharacterized protein n=1 Tax=Psychroflexus salinarum TaxID=546024 RepID=A0ABW3GTD5_9FLAO
MKSFVIYFLISIIGFQPLSLGVLSLINLPDLVEHYQLHKTEYNNSVIEFLDLHYGTQKQAHEDEHKDHENLPFQQNQSISTNFYFVNSGFLNIDLLKPDEEIQHNFNYKFGFTLLNETDILQPPKY